MHSRAHAARVRAVGHEPATRHPLCHAPSQPRVLSASCSPCRWLDSHPVSCGPLPPPLLRLLCHAPHLPPLPPPLLHPPFPHPSLSASLLFGACATVLPHQPIGCAQACQSLRTNHQPLPLPLNNHKTTHNSKQGQLTRHPHRTLQPHQSPPQPMRSKPQRLTNHRQPPAPDRQQAGPARHPIRPIRTSCLCPMAIHPLSRPPSLSLPPPPQ